jgi:hypothetical protein
LGKYPEIGIIPIAISRSRDIIMPVIENTAGSSISSTRSQALRPVPRSASFLSHESQRGQGYFTYTMNQ